VRLSIFDSRGRLLGNALDGYMAAGNYRVEVAPASGNAGFLAPGTYIIALYCKDKNVMTFAASCVMPMLKK